MLPKITLARCNIFRLAWHYTGSKLSMVLHKIPTPPPPLSPCCHAFHHMPFKTHTPSRLTDEVTKLRENASAMLETSRLEEASLRRLLETAAVEGRRLVKDLDLTERARDEALTVGRGAGGEAEGLRERLRKVLDEKSSFEKSATAEIGSKVRWMIEEKYRGRGVQI